MKSLLSTRCILVVLMHYDSTISKSDIIFHLGKFIKDVHRRQKLTTDFLKLFELTILVVTISISRKKICLPWFPGGHFLRGLITKS